MSENDELALPETPEMTGADEGSFQTWDEADNDPQPPYFPLETDENGPNETDADAPSDEENAEQAEPADPNDPTNDQAV